MRGCRDCAELLSAGIDGELSPAEMDEMQAHLSQCASCRAEHLALAEAAAVVAQAVRSVRCPETLKASVQTLLDKAAPPPDPITPRARWWQLVWAPAAAAALILLLTLLPSTIPVASMNEPLHLTSRDLARTDPATAASQLSSMLGFSVGALSFHPEGMALRAAGPININGAKGAYFYFGDAAGRQMCIYQVALEYRRTPRGTDLTRYGINAQLVAGDEGCTHIYWPQNHLLIVVCTHNFSLDDTIRISKSTAEQLSHV